MAETPILTDLEQKVFGKLMALAGKIGKPADIRSETLYHNVIKQCDAFNIVPSMMQVGEPEEVALALKSLLAKEMVMEFEFANMPSYIPKPYWKTEIKK